MPSRFTTILEFLSVQKVLLEKVRILEEVSENPDNITNIDRQNVRITMLHLDDEGKHFEETYSLDDMLLSEFKNFITKKTVDELRVLKFGSKEGILPIKASDYVNTLKNLETTIRQGVKQLQESGLPIPVTLAEITRFCKLLEKRKLEFIDEQVSSQPINDNYPFRGYRFTDPKIKKPLELLDRIADYLIQENLIGPNRKTSFISLFTESWDQTRIPWKGDPKEFFCFYATLFCSSRFQKKPLIEVKGNKLKKEQLLDYCFLVINPETDKPMSKVELRNYESKPKSNKVYKGIADIIEDLLDI
ncbi:MAG: hypothetical protein WAT37_16870 [Saprospiraceae bacterium]|nr:hypothetical protein [Chitinophagaceae bacterium]